MNIYDFIVTDNQGNDISLSKYQNKVLLIVNTATKCGLTPQYAALQSLYDTYKAQGLEILDFPCNQFLKQAPGDDEKIEAFCTLNYHTTFPRFSKINVNGKDANPLYIWLKKQAMVDISDDEANKFISKIKMFSFKNGEGDIKWNFGKFLIDKEGRVVARFSPAITPDKFTKAIEALL